MSMTKKQAREYVEEFNSRIMGKSYAEVKEMEEIETARWRNAQSEFDCDVYGTTMGIAMETAIIMNRLEDIENLMAENRESARIIEMKAHKYNSAGFEGQ